MGIREKYTKIHGDIGSKQNEYRVLHKIILFDASVQYFQIDRSDQTFPTRDGYKALFTILSIRLCAKAFGLIDGEHAQSQFSTGNIQLQMEIYDPTKFARRCFKESLALD